MPAGESREEEEADKGKNDGNNSRGGVSIGPFNRNGNSSHIKYGNTMLSLNVEATHIKFRGSWSTDTCDAKLVALFEQRNAPPSGFMQIPKYPTLTSRCAWPTIFAIAVVTPGSTCEGAKFGG